MEKKKEHFNKKNYKIRPKTPLSNKRQNSYISSKSKNKNNKRNNQNQRNSPKTIDYDELMEKHGNMIDNSFDKSNRTQNNNNNKKYKNKIDSKTPLNRSPDRDYFNKSNLNKTEIIEKLNINDGVDKNYNSNNNNIIDKKNIVFEKLIKNQKPKFKIPIIKNGNNIGNKRNSFFHIGKNKNNNIVINRYNSNNNFNNKNKNDNSEFEKMRKQINDLKKENQKLKSNTITNNNYSNNDTYINDKLLLLLNLCRKYAKKFNTLYPLCEENFIDKNNSEVFEELKSTIIQYNNMIFSEKISNLFKYKNNTDTIYEYENTLNPLDISEFEPKSMTIKITDKYKNLIKALKEENNEIKSKLVKYEKQIDNNKDILKENNNLKNKINELMEIETKYKYQNNIIENLKCQIETLNNSIKYKENTINYLQNIIDKAKINPSI